MSTERITGIAQRAENAQPAESSEAVSMLLVGILAILIYVGMVHIGDHGGGFSEKVYSPYASLQDLESRQPADGAAGLATEGRKLYSTVCVACHQPTGMGIPGQFPPLAGSEWVLAPKPDRIIRIVHFGFSGPVTVKGAQFGSVAMVHWGEDPNFKSDEAVAAVLTFIRQNKDWGNNASAVTPEEVKAVRAQFKGRDYDTPMSVDELMKVPDR